MGERIVVMNGGRIQQVAPPLEVYEHPANPFVAGFIGTPPMNLLPGTLFGRGEGLVGIRPEHLSLAAEGELKAVVDFSEPLGSETLVHVKAGESAMIVRVPGFVAVKPGGAVRLAFDHSRLVAF